ncbi:hypothetical protein Gogos_005273, partial [Gossypium gossypioides]|nr:hypothetical protein [Gossypium gossypioides]
MALSSDQTPEVAMSAFEYGKNLGLAYQFVDDVLDFTGTSASLGKGSLSDIRQVIHHTGIKCFLQGIVTAPILFAMEGFPRLKSALGYLWKSRGIQRTKELAIKHANLVAAAIDSLPESSNIDVTKSRQALINLTRILVTTNKLMREKLIP